MDNQTIENLSKKWDGLTHKVLKLETVPFSRVQHLLSETHRTLSEFHNAPLVPKETAKVLLKMDEFLYFSSMMEEKEMGEGYYRWREAFCSAEKIKESFFAPEHHCPQNTPKF